MLLLLLLGVIGSSWCQDVETEYGTVRGQTIPVQLSSRVVDVVSFYGIPFAKPPVGDLRFEPPQKAEPWSDVFVADTLPNLCMQSPVGVVVFTHPGWNKYSEDCLNLNIYAPAETTLPLPVMVWVHGGAYTGGGNIQYPGHFMAARGVVVVVINYRLGVFGFASTPDGTIPGNMAMHDQVMALQFVKDNIENFGGNPNSITIFGESAGGTSTSMLYVSPKSKGLFHRAILESGSANTPWALNPPERQPEQYLVQVANKANCTTDDTAEMLACLRDVPATQLRSLSTGVDCVPEYYCYGWAPVLDGPDGFMPDMPLTLLQQLGGEAKPQMSGICRNDGALFVAGGQDDGFTRQQFETYMRILVGNDGGGLSPDQVEAAYNALDFEYTPHPFMDDHGANRQAIVEYETDALFGFAWDREAKIVQNTADAYAFVFNFVSPNASSTYAEWRGAQHMTELTYVWAYPFLLINPAVRVDAGMYFDIIGYVDDDIVYADYVQTLWTNFAKYDNPTPTPVPAPFEDKTTVWPKYKMEDNLPIMYLDRQISTVQLYRQRDYAFFTSYLGTIADGRPHLGSQGKDSSGLSERVGGSQFEASLNRSVREMIARRFPAQLGNMGEINNEY